MGSKLLTTAAAAAELGVTPRRVQRLVLIGRLPAERVGRDYLIRQADLAAVRDRRPGRPRKSHKQGKR